MDGGVTDGPRLRQHIVTLYLSTFIAALITVLSHPGALMHFCSLVRSGRRGSRGGGGQTNAIGGSSVVFLVFLVVLRRDARSLAHQHGAQLGSLPSGLEAGTEL
jgi:hypothetical protein